MNSIDLDVPTTTKGIQTPFKKGDVQRWLEGLPKRHDSQVVEAVTAKLSEYNRIALKPEFRFEIAECLISQVELLVENISRRHEQIEFPVSKQERMISDRVQMLLAEMCISYKHVVIDLAAEGQEEAASELLPGALLQVVRLLAMRILQGYIVYTPAAIGVWKELHRLYRYAEKIDMARTRVEHLADQTAGDVYKKILLLALSNPFHLMQGEARITFDKLSKWALSCRIRHPAEYPSQDPSQFYAARFFVDMDADEPPGYGLAGNRMPPTDARILDVQPVMQIAEDQIRQMTLKGQLPVRERLARDLLRRLRIAWKGRLLRSSERNKQQRDIHIVGGLRAFHQAITGVVVFQPEQSEMKLHGSDLQSGNMLSLSPLDDEPWKQQDVRGKLETGMIKPRGLKFDMEHQDNDVWERSLSTGGTRSTQIEENLDLKFASRRGLLHQLDVSDSGIGAVCATGIEVKFRVGDLVGIADDAGELIWNVGVVSWLRYLDATHMSIGLHRIHGFAAAAAVRGMEGMGADSDYHRALSVQVGDNTTLLIVPAGSFDVGSIVLVNTGKSLELQILRTIRHSTKGFTGYIVEPVELSSGRKERLIQSLYKLLK